MSITQTNATEIKAKETKARQNPSRVRDHLANERTYLAWMRSAMPKAGEAIALMGFGVVIVRIRHFFPPQAHSPGNSWKLGLLFSLVGLVTVLLSTKHYFSIRYAIDEDTYEPSSRWVILFSIAITLLGAGVIYFVFATPLSPMSSIVPE